MCTRRMVTPSDSKSSSAHVFLTDGPFAQAPPPSTTLRLVCRSSSSASSRRSSGPAFRLADLNVRLGTPTQVYMFVERRRQVLASSRCTAAWAGDVARAVCPSSCTSDLLHIMAPSSVADKDVTSLDESSGAHAKMEWRKANGSGRGGGWGCPSARQSALSSRYEAGRYEAPATLGRRRRIYLRLLRRARLGGRGLSSISDKVSTPVRLLSTLPLTLV